MKDFEIRCDESRLETTNLIYGKFTLGPFLPGQATTFGNALRRSLLAELSGLAITAFEIIGVMQEFSTLPGLRESVLDLSLNLKQIVLTGVLPHSTPPIGFLNVRGPAIIKAIDLKLPAGVYCASPNQYIATLGSNGMLHLKFVVSIGKGYSIQPYSIYRSLSKVKLQPASTFDNTTLGAGGINYARQVGSESFKDVNFSSAARVRNFRFPIPLQAPFSGGYNKETPGFLRPNSKELHGQSKEGRLSSACAAELREQRSPTTFSTSSYKDNINFLSGLTNQKTKKEELSSTNKTKSNKGLSYNVENVGRERTNFQTFNSNSVFLPSEGKDSLIPSAHDLPPYSASQAGVLNKSDKSKISTNSWQSKEGFPKQTGQEQALSYKTSPSIFFTNEKSTGVNNYINIQTQLFQRITPHQVLPIDAVFTPVSQVNFLTEVNDRFETARENIVLEIWTNGSIHPKRALEEATLSLVQNFDILLKKIQQASSFYKGLRYWTYLQPFKFSLGEKNDGNLGPASQASDSVSQISPVKCTELRTEGSVFPKVGVLQGTRNWQRKATDSAEVKTSVASEGLRQSIEKLPTSQAHVSQYAQNKERLAKQREQQDEKLNEDVIYLRQAEMKEHFLQHDPSGHAKLEENLEKELVDEGYTEQKKVSKAEKSKSEEEDLLLQQQENLLEEELLEKVFKKDLPHSIYNLDIGNLNLSLQTFIFLKKAKIHTLLQLLTQFSHLNKLAKRKTSEGVLKQNNIPLSRKVQFSGVSTVNPGAVNLYLESNLLNEKIIEELNDVIKQFGSEDS